MPAPPRAEMSSGPSSRVRSNSTTKALFRTVIVIEPEAEAKPRNSTDPSRCSLKPLSTWCPLSTVFVKLAVFSSSRPLAEMLSPRSPPKLASALTSIRRTRPSPSIRMSPATCSRPIGLRMIVPSTATASRVCEITSSKRPSITMMLATCIRPWMTMWRPFAIVTSPKPIRFASGLPGSVTCPVSKRVASCAASASVAARTPASYLVLKLWSVKSCENVLISRITWPEMKTPGMIPRCSASMARPTMPGPRPGLPPTPSGS